MKRRFAAVKVPDIRAYEVETLRRLNDSLHEMSQPMTVLLCSLEYGVCLDSIEGMKETIVTSQEQCERLKKSVLSMQAQLREAIAEAKAAQPVV